MTRTVSGYAHVNICVTDVEAARAFYIDKLGLSLLPRPDFGVDGIWMRLGDAQLHLISVKQMPDWNGAVPHMAMYIPTDEFESTVAEFKARGIEFFMDIRQREDFGVPVKTAFCRDPDGNVIELTDVPPF